MTKLRIAIVGAGAALTAEVLALLESHDIEVVNTESMPEPEPMPTPPDIDLIDVRRWRVIDQFHGYIEPRQRTHPNSPLASRRRKR